MQLLAVIDFGSETSLLITRAAQRLNLKIGQLPVKVSVLAQITLESKVLPLLLFLIIAFPITKSKLKF